VETSHVHPAFKAIAEATRGTAFERDCGWSVGAVRDELLGHGLKNDCDIVTRHSSAELAHLLFDRGSRRSPQLPTSDSGPRW